jgi:hypothetical protein
MRTRLAALTALFTLCLGGAAMADWDTLGTIDVGPRGGMDRSNRGMSMTRDTHVFDLGGPVEKLQLRAERNDVTCRSVNATFDNGQDRRLFSGQLREGRAVNVDVPGRGRTIRRLDFNCSSDGRPAAISIVADVGGYRDAWRRSPDWQRNWAKVFNWGSNTVNNWQMVGSESFDGRNDRESSYAGFRGMRVDAVALKPLETDARCSRVVARFDNGRTQVLALHNNNTLRRGEYEKLDLPGDTRNLARLDMRCRAVDGRHVTIQVFTSH